MNSITIKKEMVESVMKALVEEVKLRGASNKMVSIELVERRMVLDEVNFFVPVRNTLSVLIKNGIVTYFVLQSGKIVYGLSKKARVHYGLEKQEEAQENVGNQ